jgi:hypothetical protein
VIGPDLRDDERLGFVVDPNAVDLEHAHIRLLA